MSQWGICADSQTLKACLFFLIISSFIYALIYRIWRSRRVFTAQLVSVIETVGEGITLSDRAGKFVIFNSEIQQITGYTIEEVNNREDFATLVQLKFQVSGQVSAIAEVLQSTVHNIEATIQAKDGTHKTLLISTSLMRHQNQNLFLSVYRDISDRYQVQEHLRLLESAVVNANDAILITSAEPITESGPSIIYVNNAFTRITGYSQEEVIGKTPRILQSTKTERSQLDKIRAALTA